MKIVGDIIEKLNINYEPSPNEILDFIRVHGKMSFEDAVFNLKKNEVEGILKRHNYSVYKEKDGRWSTYVRGEDGRGRKRITKTDYRKLIEFLYSLYLKEDLKKRVGQMTLADLYPEWMEYKELQAGEPTTPQRIERDWKKYYLGTEIITIPIVGLDKLTLDNWAHRLVRDNNLTRKQYYNLTIIMRQAFTYAVEHKYIKENVFEKVRVKRNMFRPERKKSSETQVFMVNEEKEFRDYAWEQYRRKRHKKQPLTPLAAAFLLQTGLRIGELRALTFSDILPDGNSIVVDKFIRVETGETVLHLKGGSDEREVILSDEAIRIIDEARRAHIEKGMATDGYIFSLDEKPIGYSAVNKAFYMYCEELSFVKKSTHKALKTLTSMLLAGGMSIDVVSKMMGHKDERTTLANYCYDRLTDEAKRNKINEILSS